jgi:hypothetical protein
MDAIGTCTIIANKRQEEYCGVESETSNTEPSDENTGN